MPAEAPVISAVPFVSVALIFVSPLRRRRRALQPAFLLQPHLYLGDALFAGMKRSRARVHRVVSKGEFIRVAYCRAENEFGVSFGIEVDRLIRCLEGHQLARLDMLRNS